MKPKVKGKSFKGKEGRYVPKGMNTALVTPFNSQEEVDELAIKRLVDWQIESGINGIVVTAGCGEFINLSDDERKRVLDVALEAVAGRVPVIAGILSSSTRHALELAKNAESAGASAVLVLPPYYIGPSAEGVYKHFATIADKTSIPIILYNNPGRTKIDLDVKLLDRLADIPSVVGIKECARDIYFVVEKINVVGDRIAYLAGDDDMVVQMYFFGGQGDIVVNTQIAPEPAVEMWAALERNDFARAIDIHFNFASPVMWAILGLNHPAPIKYMMGVYGHPAGPARLPLEPPSPDAVAQMKKTIDKAMQWYFGSGSRESGRAH